jgi:predicted nucleotidyltransferase
MQRAVDRVQDRLIRAVRALENAHIAYAVVGGHAVAAWVSRVDESLARYTRDVDILVRRADFEGVRQALTEAGFAYRHAASLDLFLDGPDAKARDAVHIVFASELVRPGEPAANPDVTESDDAGAFRVASLPALVRIKLTAFRDKDRTHVRDLIDAGLVDATWCGQLPAELAARLQQILDTPDG